MNLRRKVFVFILLAAGFQPACTKKPAARDANGEVALSAAANGAFDASKLSARGEQIYKLNCIACHNPDPKQDGALGPAISGSSLELITARVLKAKYPEGYKPKRETHTMPALPQLEAEIPALHAFLNR